MGILEQARWSPYAVGIGVGILSWLTFLLSDRPIGCSTAFVRSSGMIERLLRGSKATDRPYYQSFAPHIDWEWMLVAGVLVGACLSAWLSGTFMLAVVPTAWAASFGHTPVLRLIVALFGGVIMGFGARWAGGCTSGHGISGTLQLAVSGWIAAAGMFAGGIATASFLFRIIARGGP
jgi:hypothetical protein